MCWIHLKFWETLDSFMFSGICMEEFDTSRLLSMLRLYVQQGLSNRVLRALRERLERAMSGSPGEETRDRSRSPVRAVHGDGTGPDGTIPSDGGDTGAMPHGGSDVPATPNAVAPPGIDPPNTSLPETARQLQWATICRSCMSRTSLHRT